MQTKHEPNIKIATDADTLSEPLEPSLPKNEGKPPSLLSVRLYAPLDACIISGLSSSLELTSYFRNSRRHNGKTLLSQETAKFNSCAVGVSLMQEKSNLHAALCTPSLSPNCFYSLALPRSLPKVCLSLPFPSSNLIPTVQNMLEPSASQMSMTVYCCR